MVAVVTISRHNPDSEKEALSQVQATLMSSLDVARQLGITREAVSRLVRQGKLPGVKMGRSYVIPRESVDSFSNGYVPARGRPKATRKIFF